MKTLVDFCNFPIIYHNVRLLEATPEEGHVIHVEKYSILQRIAAFNKGTIRRSGGGDTFRVCGKTHGTLFPLQKKRGLWLHSWWCLLLARIVMRLGVMVLPRHIKGKHYSTALYY
jgi:hypothetical protein